jgi:site-specific recombinase XerD
MTIKELTEKSETFYRSQKYKESTLGLYRCVWNRLIDYAAERNMDEFSMELGFQFAKDRYGYDFEHLVKPTRQTNYLLRILLCLSEMQMNGSFFRRTKPLDYVWPSEFSELCCNYLLMAKKRVKPGTFDETERRIRQFISFLSQKGTKELDELSQSDVVDFMGALQRYVPATRDAWLNSIRAFLVYATENGYCKRDLAKLIPKARYLPPAKIPPTLSTEEKQRLLEAIDRASPMGKRDYAMLLLSVRLGMRSGDICGLKFSNLWWDTDEIRITQQKTEHLLTLPLLPDIGQSIIDYLKNGRPTTDSEYVFIKHCAPYDRYASGSGLYVVFRKYLQLANISSERVKHAGLHALRHSLASSLLEQGVALPVISEVLGHLNTNTTRIYTGIDVTNLKKCALEIPARLTEE